MALKDPRPAPPGNGEPEEGGGHMDLPPPGMIRNSGPNLYQALDELISDGLKEAAG